MEINCSLLLFRKLYSKYQDFVKELKNVGDFWPGLPSSLADGYEFEQGTFNAAPLYRSLDTEYEEILEQFQKRLQPIKLAKSCLWRR